ncbi:DNA polymerase III subunit gamma/tau [Salinicola acroporae]|uniref:DNA polymerase III subunit gamma/tau n=1 Tax=Salinicola acroporae TaxID=1541440 RepID=A0ABT6I6Z2_9GAMM|nr:DNA polymerase III subunit gamma/tau [Salinicola acroporae]MDH4573512.1 DNA polymerase III subunit gamma/tau [Salinicola acroporae]
MSYQVLARKWRPRTFHELIGQEHVSRALVNALDQGRLHHAYLFTGTRGVGKTTLARILAKCLNCEQGVSSQPCGQCETCRDIDNGRFVDLIEVDAASRTKVEDTRELLDNVQYAPTQGRYKVYLIDEVHMLSTHSFNALLKTLEEPPPHVKFLLATTDPQKLPVTVLSRCLQFTLKNMPPERVVEHLTRVLEAEQVAFEPQALWLLGKAADGSMRDAMSLTDQAIAFGQGEVRREDVAAMLGTLDHAHLIALAQALADVDAERLLAEVAALAEQGPDFAGVLDELSGLMHRLAIAQMVPSALDNGHGDREELLSLAGRFTAEDVQLYYQIALQGRGDIDNAPDTRSAVEMTLLRMLAFRPQGVPTPPQTELPLRGNPQGENDGGGDARREARVGEAVAGGARAEGAAQGEPMASAASTTASGLVASGSTAPEPTSVNPDEPVSHEPPSAIDQRPVEPVASSPAAVEPPADDRPPWSVDAEAADAPQQPAPAAEGSTSWEPWAAESSSPADSSTPGVDAGDVGGSGFSGNDGPGSEIDFDSDADLQGDAYAWAEQSSVSRGESLAAFPTSHEPVPASSVDPNASSAPPADMPSELDAAGIESSGPTSPAIAVETPPAAVSAGESSAPAVIDESPDPAGAAAATIPLTHDLWLERFDRLDIGGLTRNLAAHCVIDSDDGHVLHVTLDPGQSAMLSELHVDRITKALAGIGYARRLEVNVAELDGSRETAKARRDREARERHARAVEALRVDPHIQELEAQFGARLIEESVTADRV